MLYVKYTLVDVKTNIPVSEAPAKNGPKDPEGVTPEFALQDTFGASPVFYGTFQGKSKDLPQGASEVSEEDFFTILKQELKDRSREKRKEVEEGGYQIDADLFVRTDKSSQNRLSQLVNTINNDPDLVEIDFEVTPGTWTTFTPEEGLAIAKTISKHVQSCFSWCRGNQEQIDLIETTADVEPILEEIRNFEANDFEAPEEETV